jgi:formylglycine-generating enzyme required for sulfatase activity
VLGKALEDEKDDRYQKAHEFRDALRASQKLQAAPEPVAELGAGECPKCHTRNEASRKFCSESECAASLRVKCLKCEAEIPVWDKVCAECGGKQIELAEARQRGLETAREKAESLRSEYAFDESLRIAREIAAVEDSRLQHLKEWSETFIDETETEKERQEQNAANHYAEAKTHREAYDYKSAIHAMETIPEVMRTSGMSSYLQQLQSDHDESEELITTIPDRVKPSVLKGLLEQVERAVELRGDHADLLKLQIQLNERLEKLIKQRDAAYTEAASLLNEGQAKKAYRQIRRVKTQDLRASDVKLRTQLEEIVAAEDALTALVEESKADGVLDPAEVAAMWKSTDEYLKLNPRHEKIAEMQQQLVDRIERAPAEYAAVLSKLPAAVLSKLPAAVLSKLPANVLTQLPANVLTQLPPRKNTIGMQFKLWPGGTFTMGEGNETPHPVTLTKPFELGVYEVTQEQYEQVMKVPNRSKFKGPQNPVEKVSWDDAVEFCRKLSSLPEEKAAGYVYRLPTEAEWEYACRAGTQTAYNFGDSESELGDYAWYDKNAGGTTHPVGSKRPNAWGLYDMHGNVYEWCQDWYGSYPSGSVTDPTGAASGSYRVLRGGSWDYHSGSCRSAYRSRYSPGRRSLSLGFRVLRSSIK